MRCENAECNEIHIKGTRVRNAIVTDDVRLRGASLTRNVGEPAQYIANGRPNHNNTNQRNYNQNALGQQTKFVQNTNDTNFLMQYIADLDNKFQQILDLNSPGEFPQLMLPQHLRPRHEIQYGQQRQRRM